MPPPKQELLDAVRLITDKASPTQRELRLVCKGRGARAKPQLGEHEFLSHHLTSHTQSGKTTAAHASKTRLPATRRPGGRWVQQSCPLAHTHTVHVSTHKSKKYNGSHECGLELLGCTRQIRPAISDNSHGANLLPYSSLGVASPASSLQKQRQKSIEPG